MCITPQRSNVKLIIQLNKWRIMQKNNDDGFHNTRTKTDVSLKYERNKTDNYLDHESQNIEDKSDKVINSNRKEADKKLKVQRAEVDSEKIKEERGSTPLLDAERERSDHAQKIARAEEDKARNSERYQKRLVAEALLETERKDTDNNLLDERNSSDKATKQDSILIVNAENALVTRDQYLAIVSHDLKNPLSAISLGTGVLKRSVLNGKSDQESIVKSLEGIERNVASMDRMISDLLDVEQMSNGVLLLRPTNCNVNDLLNECKDLFAPVVANKSFTINIKTLNDIINANIDHDRILQVLSNLIGNALKFTPAGGTIELSAEQNENEIIISVQDNGPGIPLDKQESIFERFSQLKLNDRRGLGLGLFISKWIIEAHKGEIKVSSVAGKGSKFSFTIPSKITLH